MILYVLIALIIIGLMIRYYSNKFEYFSNCKKRELHNNMNIKNVDNLFFICLGIIILLDNKIYLICCYLEYHIKSTFRTCYPTGSADVA